MLISAILAVSVLAASLTDRCRSSLETTARIPGCESPFSVRALSASAVAPFADPPQIHIAVPGPLSAGLSSAKPFLLKVGVPPSVSTVDLERMSDRFVYAALSDGSESPRAVKWRPCLVRMLVAGTHADVFDRVYGLLLRGFAGNDDRARIRALAKWVDEALEPREAAEVFRAETRRWLSMGDPEMTADAAARMTRARPDYAVCARRLTALAFAAAGELDRAKAEIARSKAECAPAGFERHELAYLEAWIALQEGDAELARRNLTAIVAEDPKGPTARKARTILESITEETRE